VLSLRYRTSDATTIIAFVSKAALSVIQTYSVPGTALEFDISLDRVLREITANKFTQWSLYSARFGGQIGVRVIHMNSDQTRETIEGWGLISLLTQHKAGCVEYDFTANSEKRAKEWEPTYPEWSSVDSWNWPEISRTVRGLNRWAKSHDA
jgi:hypothetical protein